MRIIPIVVLLLALPSPLRAQASPDNTRVPPSTSIIDSLGDTFTLQAGPSSWRVVLCNGATTYGEGSVLVAYKGRVYTKGADNLWYQYLGGAKCSAPGWPWQSVGITDPVPVALPPVIISPIVLPPVLSPAVAKKLQWTMRNTTTAAIAAGSFRLYVDALAGATLAGRTCAAVAVDVACNAPIPTLAQGKHEFTLSFVDPKGVEGARSEKLSFVISATVVPDELDLK